MQITFLLIVTSIFFSAETKSDFRAERISRCADITIHAPIEKVFPLFGPILEKEWAEGWDPEIIFSSSAGALVEEHMIFKTRAHHLPEEYYNWAITKYEPEKFLIEYTVSTPLRIWFIQVQCKRAGSETTASICYTYTGLTSEGNDLNRAALRKMYQHDLKDWEEALNYYLKTGKQLKSH